MVRFFIFIPLLFACFSSPLQGAIAIRNGKVIDPDEVAIFSVTEHEALAHQAFDEGDYREAARQFRIVTTEFPGTKEASESYFYLGVADFYLKEYEFANQDLSSYIISSNQPEHFEEAMEYKFGIAEAFRNGAKRRFFGSKSFPKWLSGEHIAFDTYDEIIATVPNHELAAKSFFSKGCFHWKLCDYPDAIDSFHSLIRRFPKHELAPESYVMISQIYLEQSHKEFQNPDLLVHAELVFKEFKSSYPGEPRLESVEVNLIHMQEIYARGLYDTGQFYERVSQPMASVIYYRNVLEKFPETLVAGQCRFRLAALGYNNF